jgi:hypothetical protein
MNLETIPRGRPRNRWQDEVRENSLWRTVAGKVYDREERKKLLRATISVVRYHMHRERQCHHNLNEQSSLKSRAICVSRQQTGIIFQT